MFVNLPPHEKEAFFDFMDEYFSQRPHLDPILCRQQLDASRDGEGSLTSTSQAPPAPPAGRKPNAGVPATQSTSVPTDPDADAIGYAEALYAYPKSEPEDLELEKGERLMLIEKISDDWWKGRSMDGQRREGIVPSSYVQLV